MQDPYYKIVPETPVLKVFAKEPLGELAYRFVPLHPSY